MKKKLSFLTTILLWSGQVFAENNCFLVKENEKILKEDGDCKTRYAPCSTFKIALGAMGYDAGILKDAEHPVWEFKEGYADFLEIWKQDQTPISWMKYSCVWYSQVLTEKLGMDKFEKYIKEFNYGNKDISGDKGKNNGLSNSWLSSSLEISPKEKIVFLNKLLKNGLPVTKKAHKMTKKILFVEDLSNGWKLYGKTGSGYQLDSNRQQTKLQQGWFVGWIEKDGRAVTFVNHFVDDKEQDRNDKEKVYYASLRAKADAKEKLLNLIRELESKSK